VPRRLERLQGHGRPGAPECRGLSTWDPLGRGYSWRSGVGCSWRRPGVRDRVRAGEREERERRLDKGAREGESGGNRERRLGLGLGILGP
jgi:hypothetical protein